MKSSQLLREAKAYLWDGGRSTDIETRYICHALSRAECYALTHNAMPAYRRVRAVILARLAPFSTMDEWLRSKGVRRIDMTPARLQAHRHKWVDMLIAEFRAKGD